MPIQLIPMGMPVTLVQNVAYALPTRACVLTSSAAVTTSLDNSTYGAHTSGTVTGANFVKSALAGTIITCKSSSVM